MSRAFVKETANAAPPPERMVTEGPNPVTEAGFAQIVAEVARLEAALASESNVLLRETLERDLRYWTVRKASAEVQPPPAGDVVAFGAKVTFTRAGRRQTYRIVGEDEADPARGLLNVRSPLAAALLGAAPGDVVDFQGGEIDMIGVES
jgi:transcription elongation GreA/GreB family factor